MKTYLLLYCCLYMCVRVGASDWRSRSTAFELTDRYGDSEALNGTLQRIVKTYHCAVDNVGDQQIILYGTKAWTFPTQDVNLTLRYPSKNTNIIEYNIDGDFIITGLLVMLHMDGSHSRGYVTQGGILMDSISMTFLIEEISRLSYQFWLYGVKRTFINVSELTWHQNLC